MKTAIFFNLLANSSFSLLAGFLIAIFFIWFFRIETGPWKLFFLSLPFFKIVFDLARGIPSDSILYSGIDPYTLPKKHQMFSISADLTKWGPKFLLAFSVVDAKGREFAASVGDYLVIWLNRRFGSSVPLAVLTVVGAVAVIFLLSRVVQAWHFERKRRLDRVTSYPFLSIALWKRKVDVYISESFSGTPFTGGLFRPYICIPRDAFVKLDSRELDTVISHEMGHVRHFDLPTTVLIQLLGDVFWFVPGYRSLSRKIDQLREIVADQWVEECGQNPFLLASALIKLKEIPEASERYVLYSAFFRQKSLLKLRVDRLLGRTQEPPGRFGWQNRWVRYVAGVWVFTAVMLATFGGNENAHGLEGIKLLDKFLRFFGVT